MNGLALLRSVYSRTVLVRFAAVFFPLLIVLLTTASGHYYTEQRLARLKLEADEIRNLDLAYQVIVNDLQTVASDLMFLSQLNELQEMVERPDLRTAMMLSREFLLFSENRGNYDQVRYLSADGAELVRINYHDGHPRIVQSNQLQSKTDRYYFREAMALDKGEIYISPFDLNVEHESIERPLKPVIRFATPLFDNLGRQIGILMVNFLGDRLIQHFHQAAVNIANHVHLVNADGYWLSSPRPDDAWGFMLGHDRTFARASPAAWRRISENNAGQFYNEEGLFTFSTVRLPVSIEPDREPMQTGIHPRIWKIVAHIPPPLLAVAPADFLRRHLLPYGTMMMLLLLGSFILARAAVRHHVVKTQREYDRRFRATLENIKLAALTLDTEGRIVFCNDFMLAQTGWAREEILGRRCVEVFIPPGDQPMTGVPLARMSLTRKFPATFENRIRTRSGEVRLYTWNSTLSFDPDGDVCAVTCIGEDITDQRQAAEQIRKLSRAVEQSPNPVIITDAGGIIEYVNPKFTQQTGYALVEAIGRKPSMLKSGETTQREYEELWRTIKAGGEWRGLLHNRKKNGELYWEYTAISPIRNAEGKITHFLAVKEDVTERKRLEEEIARRNRELAQAQGLAVVGRMASMIAHDLRNPLSSVKMALQILGKRTARRSDGGDSDNETQELKQIALDQVRYMDEILADLLQYSRPDALKPEWLSIDKLLDITISSNEKFIQEHGAKVVTDYQPHLPTIHADATKLRQVFNNLIMNALQATENTGRTPAIRIHAELELGEPAPRLRVELHDNGLGIDAAQADRLFEPFFTTRAKGTGLGLAIVKRIVEQHHGRVTLTRDYDGGACATVILPTGPVEG